MLHETLPAAEVEVKLRGRKPRTCGPSTFWHASSTLLSRLAEAVDGNRKGAPVWYVAERLYHPYKKGHEVHGPFENCEDARKARKDLKDEKGKKYGIFGPYWTRKDHPDTIARDGKGPRVEKVVVHLCGGGTIELGPEDADAVFWSRAAVDKFVIPYYVGIGSLIEGTTIREAKGVIIVHRPGSEWRSETSRIKVNGMALAPDPGIGTVALCVDSSTGSDKPGVTAQPLF